MTRLPLLAFLEDDTPPSIRPARPKADLPPDPPATVDRASQPVRDLARIDTRPGAPGDRPMTPPEGWTGDDPAYATLLQARLHEHGTGQRLLLTAWIARARGVEVSGPRAAAAQAFLAALQRPVGTRD